MYQPLESKMQSWAILRFDAALLRQALCYPRHALDELYLGHLHESLVLYLVHLRHHGAVEAHEHISLGCVDGDVRSLYDRFELSQAHE